MLKFIIGLFFVLHGLVHLLYFSQSRRLFELQPGMVWPDGSWSFSRLLGDEAARWLAGICCVVAAAGFMAGGLGVMLMQSWWRPMVIGSALLSALLYILFWDGQTAKLADKGAVALLIDLAILVGVFLL